MTSKKFSYWFIKETTSYFEYIVFPSNLESLSISYEEKIIRIPRNIFEKRRAMVEHRNEIIALNGKDWYDNVIFSIILNIESNMVSNLFRDPIHEEMLQRRRKCDDHIRYMTQHFEYRDGKKILVTQHLD
ncbi:hypothetical protein IA831_14010 [Listeria marthii]|uniref:hypothetical protein n=1 Tax=Listeria marthii TaxID=529731 RepID=UPI001888F0A1|nr:hypothetical protein [Listeria marthii]MBF2394650.1 hypothetical protein [Listeria marthii]